MEDIEQRALESSQVKVLNLNLLWKRYSTVWHIGRAKNEMENIQTNKLNSNFR